jgi:L-ascorbate metabolism protein UlaG (beta-lactamase superfamily)
MIKITFIGHSTVLISYKDQNIITDPLYVNRIMVLKRGLKPGIPLEKLPEISTITISHAHTDHLNGPSLKHFDKKITCVVPENTAHVLKKMKFENVRELKNYDHLKTGDIKIISVPVNHGKGRFFPWEKTGVASYIFSVNGKNILVAGDVDYGPLDYFKDISEKFNIHTIMLPVGGMRGVEFYEKRVGKKGVHIDPRTALEIFKIVKAEFLIPIHWGSISLSKKNLFAAPQRLMEIAKKNHMEDKIIVLKPGEFFEI